jgi:hypothetical protein
MVQKALGNKCLVDTFRVWDNEGDIDKKDISIFVEMDGLSWDSSEYATLEEFLQSIINYAYNVTMGKE